jgi:hypothetical protein
MKRLLLVPAAIALVAVGLAAGHHLATSDKEPAPAPPPAEQEVTFRTATGETRTVTATEAAERIERLEAAVSSRRRRSEETDAPDAAAPAPAGDPPTGSALVKKDGKEYSAAELRDLAKSSDDAALRLAAIRELRKDDTDESRAVLRTLLDDKAAPSDVREAAATSLATPPNRDKLSDQLVSALADEGDAAVRRALAQGVSRMRDRDAYMPEIVAAMQAERDPETKKALFFAVVRDAGDPAARAALLAVAVDGGATLDDRRAAVAAMRNRGDAETVAKLTPLLTDPDAKIREGAVQVVAGSRAIAPSALAAALADDNAGVGPGAGESGGGRLPQFANDKNVLKADWQQLVDSAVRMAASDPDAAVRRAAVQQVGNLPKDVRDRVLETGRNDPDLFVKLTSYARSPDPIAKTGTNLFVSALDSDDQNVRGFAYRQLQRLGGVTAPFDQRWNAKARAAAIDKIRQDLAATNR